MDEYQSLSHTKWECKYHVVFIPKFRRKMLFGSCVGISVLFCGSLRSKRKKVEGGHS